MTFADILETNSMDPALRYKILKLSLLTWKS